MTADLISLATVALIAAVTPIVAHSIPGKPIPETVFLLVAGALLGPYMAGLIQITDSVTLLSDLGLAFLFLLAGYEINPKHLTGSQGKRGLATWVFSLVLAFGIVLLIPSASSNQIEGIAIAIALTTTALGTLMPILKERNLLGTRIGESILAYGTYGELGPILAMALLLSTRAEWKTILILAAFVAVAVLAAVLPSRARRTGGKIASFLTVNANTTAQMAMRVTVLLLVGLVTLSALFDLDIVLGAFAAGFVLRYVIPDGDNLLEMKLDGIAYGFLIPIFFTVSGAKIQLSAVFARPDILIGFILLLLLVRTVPILFSLSRGKDTRDMSPSSRITVALYCTTALPVIVAVTSVAVEAGAMDQAIASVLVSAGAITVFLMPFLASITYRVVDVQPIEAVREIVKNPHDFGKIARDHLALERMLAKQDSVVRAAMFGRARAKGMITHHLPGGAAPMESWIPNDHVEHALSALEAENLDRQHWEDLKRIGDNEWDAAKAAGDETWRHLKAEGDQRWNNVKELGDEKIDAEESMHWENQAAELQGESETRRKAEIDFDKLLQRASAAHAADADRVAQRYLTEQSRRLAALQKHTPHDPDLDDSQIDDGR